MVDKILILRKLSELEQYHGQIKEYEGITLAQYVDDWKIQRIVERTLQMMIETCVDIAGHIISDRKYRVPKGYADAFKVLHEEGDLDEGLFRTMDKMAKFRNIVVHDYDKVDAEIVVTILEKHLDSFVEYKDAIVEFLKEESSGSLG